MKYIIETENLSKSYFVGDSEIKSVENVNLKIKRGSFTVIIGSSGSGKTTLINLMTGLERPSKGHVLFNEQSIEDMKEYELTKLRCRKIGFVFQLYNLIPILSTLENVELPTIALGLDRKEGRKRAIRMLKQVGLEQRLHHKPLELSGGEQHRVALARAMVNNPDVLVADEPTANMDSVTGVNLINLMKRLNKEKGVTIITATHDSLVSDQAEELFTMMDGRIVEHISNRK